MISREKLENSLLSIFNSEEIQERSENALIASSIFCSFEIGNICGLNARSETAWTFSR